MIDRHLRREFDLICRTGGAVFDQRINVVGSEPSADVFGIHFQAPNDGDVAIANELIGRINEADYRSRPRGIFVARAVEFPVAGPRILLLDRVVWTRAATITIKNGYIRRNGLVSARKKPAVVNTAINKKAARNASAISVWMAAS